MKNWQLRDRKDGRRPPPPLVLMVLVVLLGALTPEELPAAAAGAVSDSTLRSRQRRARMTPNERTKERARYAQKRRVDLVKLLSPDGKCSGCGEPFEHPSLTIQHAGESGASFVHNRSSQHGRAAAYWREYKAGVPLEAMCGSCNSRDGRRHYGKYRRAA